ncbi:MAG: class I SAM-dependent methyltransferase [Labilithrix sp.]|nr:class I SAM-dependent methyltransferase [Labilithrix sp.]MCW5813417.1 class I SAM-dependent methyltransferase [Labilithrix sp.]
MFHPEGPTFAELMRQALASTERGYDLLAPKFDRTPFRTPDAVITEMIAAIGEAGAALDVCCGTGAVMQQLRAVCSERVVGVDFSQGMLDEARRRLEGAPGEARIELVRGDALELPFLEEMDVVTSAGAFGHVLVEDEDRFIAGIARTLKPGGRFVFPTTRAPRMTDGWFWMAHGFNAVMRVRNALRRPPFIMYYLTFLWPEVRAKLERNGFSVRAAEHDRFVIVTATKR